MILSHTKCYSACTHYIELNRLWITRLPKCFSLCIIMLLSFGCASGSIFFVKAMGIENYWKLKPPKYLILKQDCRSLQDQWRWEGERDVRTWAKFLLTPFFKCTDDSLCGNDLLYPLATRNKMSLFLSAGLQKHIWEAISFHKAIMQH